MIHVVTEIYKDAVVEDDADEAPRNDNRKPRRGFKKREH